MKAAWKGGELLRYSELNGELHGAIRSIADHQTAARIIEQLRGQIVRHQFRLALVPGRPAVSLPQHEAIVTAIAAGDPQAAEQAMHEHIDSVIEALRGLLSSPDGRTEDESGAQPGHRPRGRGGAADRGARADRGVLRRGCWA